MNQLFFLFSNVSTLLFISCQPSINIVTEQTANVSVNAFYLTDTQPSAKISGVYSGVFPGDVTHTILLRDDHTYKHEQRKFNDETTYNKGLGNWTVTGDKIFLTKSGKPGFNIVFEKVGDTLFGVLVNGVKPTDSTLYSVTRIPAAWTREHWRKEAAKGVIFTALGNEPFWNLKIYNSRAVLDFSSQEKEISFSSYRKEEAGDTVVYIFGRDSSTILRVFSQFCYDGMSDFVYEYRVALDNNGKILTGCGILSPGIRIEPED